MLAIDLPCLLQQLLAGQDWGPRIPPLVIPKDHEEYYDSDKLSQYYELDKHSESYHLKTEYLYVCDMRTPYVHAHTEATQTTNKHNAQIKRKGRQEQAPWKER